MSAVEQAIRKRSGDVRQYFLILGAFALGGLTASAAFWSRPPVTQNIVPGQGREPDSEAASPASPRPDDHMNQGGRPRPWLPTRTFVCPRCGGAVPTNDNSLPILLLGFLGQGAFGLRFVIQWIASERAKASVIPVVFWWLSILGGVLLLLYGWALLAWPIIIAQGLNCVIYGRNLTLLKRRAEADERGCDP